jgi:hypothetical protein
VEPRGIAGSKRAYVSVLNRADGPSQTAVGQDPENPSRARCCSRAASGSYGKHVGELFTAYVGPIRPWCSIGGGGSLPR